MYTVQFIIAGYAMPDGSDVQHYNSLESIARALQSEHDSAENYGAGYEPSKAIIWKGELDSVQDIYPDKVAIIGPRGGVSFSNC